MIQRRRATAPTTGIGKNNNNNINCVKSNDSKNNGDINGSSIHKQINLSSSAALIPPLLYIPPKTDSSSSNNGHKNGKAEKEATEAEATTKKLIEEEGKVVIHGKIHYSNNKDGWKNNTNNNNNKNGNKRSFSTRTNSTKSTTGGGVPSSSSSGSFSLLSMLLLISVIAFTGSFLGLLAMSESSHHPSSSLRGDYQQQQQQQQVPPQQVPPPPQMKRALENKKQQQKQQQQKNGTTKNNQTSRKQGKQQIENESKIIHQREESSNNTVTNTNTNTNKNHVFNQTQTNYTLLSHHNTTHAAARQQQQSSFFPNPIQTPSKTKNNNNNNNNNKDNMLHKKVELSNKQWKVIKKVIPLRKKKPSTQPPPPPPTAESKIAGSKKTVIITKKKGAIQVKPASTKKKTSKNIKSTMTKHSNNKITTKKPLNNNKKKTKTTTGKKKVAIKKTIIQQKKKKKKTTSTSNKKKGEPFTDFESFIDIIRNVQETFYNRYGKQKSTMIMYQRAITIVNKDEEASIKHTAERLLRAANRNNDDETSSNKNKPFVMSFGGYSVTAGRGNYFNQSFPLVLSNILQEPFNQLGLDLIVRNAGIGGVSSFPYGWCLDNYLGDDADVISWDFSMNEGPFAFMLESFLRHTLIMPKNPMLILIDSKETRLSLLRDYIAAGEKQQQQEDEEDEQNDGTTIMKKSSSSSMQQQQQPRRLVDPITVHRAGTPSKYYLKKDNEDRPLGYRDWKEWGTPPGSPGQNSWHAKKKEHELLAWTISFHMLKAIEVAGQIMWTDPYWESKYKPYPSSSSAAEVDNAGGVGRVGKEKLMLPAPMRKLRGDDVEDMIPTLMHGDLVPSEEGDVSWHFNRISCRTAFQPAIRGNLSSIVVSGVSSSDIGGNNNTRDQLKDPRTDADYVGGWVYDMGDAERMTKRKVNELGGFGYLDDKTSLYGTAASETLTLWLPYEGPTHFDETEEDDKAVNWFNTIVVCEVNEIRGGRECRLNHDVQFKLGGFEASSVYKVKSAGGYLGKELCFHIVLPPEAKITKRRSMKKWLVKQQQKQKMEEEEAATKTTSTTRRRNEEFFSGGRDDDVGLRMEVTVTEPSLTRAGACSISHVVWEQH